MHALSTSQRSLLKKGKITTLSDLILTPAQEISKRCRVSPLEIKAIVDSVCKANPPQVLTLDKLLLSSHHGTCTSGDKHLDAALGGGFRTGMIWEVVGESAAGKTQLGLSLALLAQLSEDNGGLSGSTCYMITSGKLPTSRLMQIAETHPVLASSDQCGLDDVHTMSTPNIDFLILALSTHLPQFIELKLKQQKHVPTTKPVRLLVIDALGELFHSSEQTSTKTLIQRSHSITEISSCLHSIASKYGIAVIVLNEVVDAFDRDAESDYSSALGLSYTEQSRWFGRAHSVAGENRKEASLGLVWANQVNARIMMTRTGRRRYVDSGHSTPEKRQKITDGAAVATRNPPSDDSEQLELVRRLSIIFSAVSSPASLDYIVTPTGLEILPEDDIPGATTGYSADVTPQHKLPPSPAPMPGTQIAPLDLGFVEGDAALPSEPSLAPEDDDEWEAYWQKEEITEETHPSAALEPQNSCA